MAGSKVETRINGQSYLALIKDMQAKPRDYCLVSASGQKRQWLQTKNGYVVTIHRGKVALVNREYLHENPNAWDIQDMFVTDMKFKHLLSRHPNKTSGNEHRYVPQAQVNVMFSDDEKMLSEDEKDDYQKDDSSSTESDDSSQTDDSEFSEPSMFTPSFSSSTSSSFSASPFSHSPTPVSPFDAAGPFSAAGAPDYNTSADWLRFVQKPDTVLPGCDFSINDILTMSPDQLAENPDFLPLICPARTTSKLNPNAPTLTGEIISAMNEDRQIRSRILKMIFHILEQLFGIRWDGSTLSLEPGAWDKIDRWLTCRTGKNQHFNDMITRILNFMQECDLPETQPLYCFLQNKLIDNYLAPDKSWGSVVFCDQPITGSTPASLKPKPVATPRIKLEYTTVVPDAQGICQPVLVTPDSYQLALQEQAPTKKPDWFPKVTTYDNTTQGWAVRYYDKRYPDTEYLSNTAIAPFLLEGIQFLSVEHYFHYQKIKRCWKTTADQQLKNTLLQNILAAQSGGQAASIGQNRAYGDMIDFDRWDTLKLAEMRRAMKAKFEQNEELQNQLLATGPLILVEDTPAQGQRGYNKEWGNAGDDSGRNLQGILLATVRAELYQNRYGILPHEPFCSSPQS